MAIELHAHCMKTIIVGKKYRAIVSDRDFDMLSQYSWYASKTTRNIYASTSIKGRTVYMHRLVMAAQKGHEIDHINNNSLDNQRENLRFCTSSQNKANMRLRLDNKSGYKGINFDKQTGKWRARIKFNGKEYSLGRHNKLKDAVKARKAALTLHGEFAKI